jgi:hypothetical protein
VILGILRAGLAGAVRQAVLALPLYLATLALALVTTAMVALALGWLAEDRPWALGILGGDWLTLLVELVAAAGSAGQIGDAPGDRRGGASAALALTLLLGPGIWLFQALAYAFLAGGIVERLRAGPPAPFWPACRRWFGPFVQLGLLGGLLLVALTLAGSIVLASLPAVLGSTVPFLVGAAGLAVLNGCLELARVGMVGDRDPDAPRALARAARLVLDRRVAPVAFAVWLALGLAGAGLLGLQAGALDAPDPLASFAVSQALQLAGAWMKVLRLSTALALERRLAASCVPSH